MGEDDGGMGADEAAADPSVYGSDSSRVLARIVADDGGDTHR